MEFVQLCVNELWNVPMEQISLALQNVSAAKNAIKNRTAAKKKALSQQVDGWASVTVPVLYILSQVILFNLEFSDNYLEVSDNLAQTDILMDGSAVKIDSFTTLGIIQLTLFLGALVLVGFASWLMRRVGRTQVANKLREEKAKVEELQESFSKQVKRSVTRDQSVARAQTLKRRAAVGGQTPQSTSESAEVQALVA